MLTEHICVEKVLPFVPINFLFESTISGSFYYISVPEHTENSL